jgi:ribosomal-protein-alanine N-acetyltransferase
VTLHGEHVWLARPRPEDEAEFLAAVERSRDLHEPWVRAPGDAAAFAEYVARGDVNTHFGFLVREVEQSTLVGVININEIVYRAFRSGYLGYYGFAQNNRRGLMTEALPVVIGHAFGALGLHRLEANIQPGNEASRKLAQRCGFRLEGFSPDYLMVDGAWRDHERWAITAPDA